MTTYSYMILFLYVYYVNYFNTAKVVSHKTSQNMEMLACEGGTLLANSVCIPQTYLKGQVPTIPTIVASRIEITNIRDVNDKKMRISLEMYLETLWIDNRLETSLLDNEILVLNNNLINLIWKPDLWIQNLFHFRIHTMLEPTGGLVMMNKKFCENKEFSLIAVRGSNISGTTNCADESSAHENLLIMYNMEAEIQLYCNFHFENYPMDIQTCDFVMNSAYPNPDIVNLSFEQGQFGDTDHNLSIDEFRIQVIFRDNFSPTGIKMFIKLERRILPFIIKYYVPCMAVTVISLINYCIPVDCPPARITLLVTQFLTLINILIYQQAS